MLLLPALALSQRHEYARYARAWMRHCARERRFEWLRETWPGATVLPSGACIALGAGGVERNRVVCADWSVLLGSLPNNSVDLICIDPPYNTTELDFEEAIDWPAFWSQARRVLRDKHCPVVSFSQQPFTTDLINSNRKGWRDEIIWEKTMPVGFLDAKKRPLNSHENLQVFADAAFNYFPVMEETNDLRSSARKRDGKSEHYNKHERVTTWQDSGKRYPRSVWKFAQRHSAFEQTRTLHPTEKPVALVERIIETFSRPDDLIVDCFCGSGSVAVAARNTRRDYIIGDKDPCCVTVATERLSHAFTPTFDFAPAARP